MNYSLDNKKNIYDWLVDTLDMLRHNTQNVLVERWEKRNLGRAVTPPIFEDRRPMTRDELVDSLPPESTLQQKVGSSFTVDGRIIVVTEQHVNNLKEQMKTAQNTIGRYNRKLSEAQGPDAEVVLENKIENHEKKLAEAAQELADIYAYIYSE